MTRMTAPTEREFQILEILWDRGEATVREVYEALRVELGIAQNTVQTFLRTMTDKKLVKFRRDGRTFVYRPIVEKASTKQRLLRRVLQSAFDGAIDQLVESAVSMQKPTGEEIARLRELLDRLEDGFESENSRKDSGGER